MNNTKFTRKSLQFSENDEKMLETAKKKYFFVDSDIGILRYALYNLLFGDPSKVVEKETPPNKVNKSKQSEMSPRAEQLLKEYSEERGLCRYHNKMFDECGCLESGEFKRLLMEEFPVR